MPTSHFKFHNIRPEYVTNFFFSFIVHIRYKSLFTKSTIVELHYFRRLFNRIQQSHIILWIIGIISPPRIHAILQLKRLHFQKYVPRLLDVSFNFVITISQLPRIILNPKYSRNRYLFNIKPLLIHWYWFIFIRYITDYFYRNVHWNVYFINLSEYHL